jgi:hypothetical protein
MASGHLNFDHAIGVDADLSGPSLDIRRRHGVHALHRYAAHHLRLKVAAAVQVQADDFVVISAQRLGGQLRAGAGRRLQHP